MAYRYADRNDRWKAITAVLAVHVVLGAVILSGLNVEIASRVADRLETFSIRIPEPPPEEPPPEPMREDSAPEEAGAPGKKADPTPIVAPKPEIVLPPREVIAAAVKPGSGSASTSGAASSGTGTGAGGSGTGRGGGGAGGGGGGFTPAQRVSKIPDSLYQRFVSTSGIRRGRVGLTVKVNTDGRPSNCRIVRSSGNPSADSLMCQLTMQYVRFRPARDPQGRPVAQDISWYPDWSPR